MSFLTDLGYKLFMEPISDLSTQALKKDEELYVAGKITREEFERRTSEIIDGFDRSKLVKKKGMGYRRWRVKKYAFLC